MGLSSTPINPIAQKIIDEQPPILDFAFAATTFFPYSRDAAYVARRRGVFPVRVREMNGKLVVFVADLLEFLATGESQSHLSAPLHKKIFRVRTGRPSKRETLEAHARGITVPQLRRQSKKEAL